jgi:hypothetical protein
VYLSACKESDLAYNLFAIEKTQEIYAYTWLWHVRLGLHGRSCWEEQGYTYMYG